MDTVSTYIESHKERFLDELTQLIRIPSISAQSKHKPDIEKCAQYIADDFKRMGLEGVEICQTPGNPIVYAEWLHAPGKPTVLIYGHYDVQPPDPLNEWQTPPFEATVKNGVVYGRGTADDKGQFLIHLKAVEYYLKEKGELPINVKFMIEGEEEVGSTHLDSWIETNRKKLACDAVMISDTEMLGIEEPCITYSLRGVVYFEMTLQGPDRDLHSGTFGGAVANPIYALAQIISKMKDDKGKVLIPGFYDDVRELSADEKKVIDSLPFDQKAYQKELGIQTTVGESGYSVPILTTMRPTFEVCGIWGGYMGEGPKAIIPARASAKINLRLVPNQDPNKVIAAVEAYIRSLVPPGITLVGIQQYASNPAAITDPNHPAMKAALKALSRAFGKESRFKGAGGSIPVVLTFQQVLKAQSVMMGIGSPDENIHSPNEKLYLSHFYKGIMASIYFMEEMSQLKV